MGLKVKEINEALQILSHIDESFIQGGISTHYIEVHEKKGEIQVQANVAGLVHIAKEILKLAANGNEGAHHHFDESGLVDNCEKPLIVAIKKASWDL